MSASLACCTCLWVPTSHVEGQDRGYRYVTGASGPRIIPSLSSAANPATLPSQTVCPRLGATKYRDLACLERCLHHTALQRSLGNSPFGALGASPLFAVPHHLHPHLSATQSLNCIFFYLLTAYPPVPTVRIHHRRIYIVPGLHHAHDDTLEAGVKVPKRKHLY